MSDNHVYAITVNLLRPPKSLSSSSRPWITTRETTANHTMIFRHPLTSKPHSFNLPRFYPLNPLTLSVNYAIRQPYSVDKLLAHPKPFPFHDVARVNLFALYGGGQLQGCPRHNDVEHDSGVSPWVELTTGSHSHVKFDDIIVFLDKVFAVDRQGITYLVNYYKNVRKINMGKPLNFKPLTPGSGRFGWRKRFVVDGVVWYVVVRMEEKLFQVFRLKAFGTTCYDWDRVKRFKDKKVLFMARDHYFFLRASRKFPGREYKNCIVFSEAAFPQYGKDGWEFSESDNVQKCEDDIAVFRLGDERFAREDEWENSGFPKIDWSPPDWILNVSSFPDDAFKKHSESESSSSQSAREPDGNGGLDSDSGNKNVGEVQSNLKVTNSKDEGEQDEMETEFSGQDKDEGGLESDSESKDQEDKKVQCDSNSREKEDEEMYSKEAIIEGDALLQKDPVTPSCPAVEEEVTRTLLRMNSGNDTMEEGTSVKNMTQAIPKASTSSMTE